MLLIIINLKSSYFVEFNSLPSTFPVVGLIPKLNLNKDTKINPSSFSIKHSTYSVFDIIIKKIYERSISRITIYKSYFLSVTSLDYFLFKI